VKNREEILQRLLRAARHGEEPATAPFGFSTRVLALARESAPNGSAMIASFARRAGVIAVALIALGGAGLYRTSVFQNSWDISSEYGVADTAIQNNLSE
jgi:hypothetical protein